MSSGYENAKVTALPITIQPLEMQERKFTASGYVDKGQSIKGTQKGMEGILRKSCELVVLD
jgi:hypothetical protein